MEQTSPLIAGAGLAAAVLVLGLRGAGLNAMVLAGLLLLATFGFDRMRARARRELVAVDELAQVRRLVGVERARHLDDERDDARRDRDEKKQKGELRRGTPLDSQIVRGGIL